HQEGAKQVDKGLYGALIVEPENKVKPDRDFTLILDEWQEKPMDEMGSMPGDGHNGGHGDMKMNGQDPLKAEEQMMKESYNIFTVNAKAGNLISPLEVKKGEVVRLRLINAGYRSHGIHIPGQEFKVVSTDGQDIEGAALIKDQVILVAPGERYDVEFVVSSDESFVVDAHDSNLYNDQIKIPVKVTDGNGTFRTEAEGVLHPIFDLAAYGNGGSSQFAINQSFSVDYNVILNTKVDQGLQYTINGKTFGELPALKIKTEDTVKFTFDNRSAVDHPMHLHGHFFQVLSRNGTPLKAVIIKDTLMVKPGEKYIVAFKADNPGNWVQHCHELHHAAAGMMQKIEYTDFKSNYISDPKNTYNKPE
ncbi:MAG: multicopper oxidase family protein, partial [Clostridia bacterium]|nr:multicopper oxidase family protein [Clostridia bacterium]